MTAEDEMILGDFLLVCIASHLFRQNCILIFGIVSGKAAWCITQKHPQSYANKSWPLWMMDGEPAALQMLSDYNFHHL